MFFSKKSRVFLVASIYFLCNNLALAQDEILVESNEVAQLIPATINSAATILQERENLNTGCRNYCVGTIFFVCGSLTVSMVVSDILECSLPLHTYTICNASNDTVNIAYDIKSLFTVPTITILENDNCYGLQTQGSLQYLCAYNADSVDTEVFGSSTDDMKCATNKGLEHDFQWYVDEKLYLHRGKDSFQNDYLQLPYTELATIEDENFNAIDTYNLRGTLK